MSELEALQEKRDIIRLQQEYGLSAKQAAYAMKTIREPEKPVLARARDAGYSPRSVTTNGYERLKGTKLTKAMEGELAKQVEIKRKAEEMSLAIAKDPRAAIQNKLLEHSESPDITPNQTRALELVGKMNGVFVERFEIDPGQNLRLNMAGNFLAKISQSQE